MLGERPKRTRASFAQEQIQAAPTVRLNETTSMRSICLSLVSSFCCPLAALHQSPWRRPHEVLVSYTSESVRDPLYFMIPAHFERFLALDFTSYSATLETGVNTALIYREGQ